MADESAPTAGKHTGGVIIGDVTGGIHGTTIAGRDVNIYNRSQLEELRDYLAQGVADYRDQIQELWDLVDDPPAAPTQPYKFLDWFKIKDAPIFFGRGEATEKFVEKVLDARLTVLHARSGAGKTSLLNAGLSPRLIRARRLPVYARPYGDLIRAAKLAIVPPSRGPWPALLHKLSLHEFLHQVCAHLGRWKGLVLILDQFEEFFIFSPERDCRQPLVDALADCYNDETLPMHLVIAIRKDYYSDLADFEERVGNIFTNQFRLNSMTREEAEMAIRGPVAMLDRTVTYESALLDALLDDLMKGGVELPHLQIICTRLYEGLAKSETTITLAAYEALGRVEGVLGHYLQDVLDELPGKGADIAKAVLTELVSSEATKRVLSYEVLAARIEAKTDELEKVLARLVDDRLLRRDEVAGEVVYEMAHEHLIGEVGQWLDETDLAFKQAEELLAREVANWRVHRTLIPKDRLQLLHAHRERFKGLDDESRECILHSALEADHAIEGWARFAGVMATTAVLDDKDHDVRKRAASVMGEIGDSRAVEPLIAALLDEHEDVRSEAAQALGKISYRRAVDPLVAALRDGDEHVRESAARALGEIGDSRAAEPLIAALGDKNWDVRWSAAEALGEIREPAVEPLIAALQDKDEDVRESAARALGEIREPAVEPLIAALRGGDEHVRKLAASALGEIGDSRAVDPLIATMRDGDQGEDVRSQAARALGKIGDRLAVEPLIAALRDGDVHVRDSAASALGEIGDSRAVDPLIAALRDGDQDEDVRSQAARALGKIGDRRAVEPLTAALSDGDVHVRDSAAEALGKIHEPTVGPLIAALRDGDVHVRNSASEALGKIGEPAVGPLIAALRDEDVHVRDSVAEALREIGEPAVEPLIAALGDGAENVNVRREAARALGEIGDRRAVEPLIAALGDESVYVHTVAARALREIGDHRAVEPLIAALGDGAENVNVRREAARALGEIGDRRAVEPLIAALGDKSVYVHTVAARALGEIGDRRAVEPLIAALGHKDWDVREQAEHALRRIDTPEARAALESARQ